MPRYVQPSLFSKTSRSLVDVFFKTGGMRLQRRKTHSGGVRRASGKYTVGGDSWARKTAGRRRFIL